jgi:hypothetical protein
VSTIRKVVYIEPRICESAAHGGHGTGFACRKDPFDMMKEGGKCCLLGLGG